MKFAVVLFSIAALAYSSPVPQDESVLKLVIGNFVDCMNSDLNLCLKEHALRVTERLRSVRAINIVDGLTIRNNGAHEPRSLEPLSEDSQLRTKQVTERLWEQTTDLLKNSELEISYGDEDEQSRAIGDAEEGRGKKKKEMQKKLKLIVSLLALAKAKAIALALLFLGIIALSLYKIAVIAKITFIAKAVAIIKALLAKKHGHEEHGYVSVEEHGHDHGHDHGHGWENQGWGRSRNEANELAYSAYKTQ